MIQALERNSGQVAWQFNAKNAATSPAMISGRLIVGTRESVLYALDPADGHTIWTQYWWGSWVESTAVARDGLASIGSGDLDRVSCIDPMTGRNRCVVT